MIQVDLTDRGIHSELSHDTDSSPSCHEKEVVEAVEKMLAKHYYSTTDRVVQQERPNYADVFISPPESEGLAEDEQRAYEFNYVRESIYRSVVKKFLQDRIARNRERLANEKLKEEIFASITHGDLLGLMKRENLGQYVEDYYNHLRSRQEDLDRDESPGVILQSLQSWVWFLIDFAERENIPRVSMRADFFGCVELVWRLSPDPIPSDPDNEYYGNGKGIVVLTFFPSHLNHISVMSGAYGVEKRRIAFHGEFSHAKTKKIFDSFIERLLPQNA